MASIKAWRPGARGFYSPDFFDGHTTSRDIRHHANTCHEQTTTTTMMRTTTTTKGKATAGAAYVFCLVAIAVIAISDVPAPADAFIEPFVSHLLAKKMLLKQGLAPQQLPQAQASFYYGGHYQQQPRPTPVHPVYGPPQPPSPTYPAYGPQPTTSYPSYGPQPTTSYPSYGPQPTPGYPSYGPPSNSGYESQPIVKPAPPSQSGCLPGSSYPIQSTDYSNYVVHGGHGFGIYGNNGNNGNAGTYGK